MGYFGRYISALGFYTGTFWREISLTLVTLACEIIDHKETKLDDKL